MLVMTNYSKNDASSPGRLPWMKGAGMLVVSFGGVNFGFWSHFCLVPRPHYSAAKAFRVTWSKRCSPRIRHRSELTERDWEIAVQIQGLGMSPA